VTETRKPPVFIVGSPRSGTTLLKNLLGRHPSIAICRETRFFADIYRRRAAFGPLENLQNRQRLVDQYLSTAQVKRLQVDLSGLRQRLLDEATSYPALLATMMRYYADFHGKERYGEKTPHHSFCTEMLSDWYPGASIIHLVRDPRDVVASLQRMPWAPKSILNNASMWLLFNRAAERSRHRPGYLLVHYEKLVTSPDQELARICGHIGEEWPASLTVPTDPSAAYSWPKSASGPVTRERLQKWKEQLSAKDVSLVERIAGARLEHYGYERSGRPASLAAIIPALAVAGFDAARRRIAHIPYTWFYLTRPTNLALHEHWKFRRTSRSDVQGVQYPDANDKSAHGNS
jgi:Sulfotransferase family